MNPQQESATFRRQFARRKQTVDEAQCPPPETLFDAARGALAHHSLNEVIDHVGECAQCSESWRLARELAIPAISTTETKKPLLFAMATAATIALSANVWLNMHNNTTNPGAQEEIDSPVFRGSEPAADIRNSTLTTFRGSSLILRWQTQESCTSYSIVLMDEDLNTLWSAASVVESNVTVPTAALANVHQGDVLFWQVEAWRDGVRKEVSGLFSITATAE